MNLSYAIYGSEQVKLSNMQSDEQTNILKQFNN